MSTRRRFCLRALLVTVTAIGAGGVAPGAGYAAHAEIASFDATLAGGLSRDLPTTKAGIEVVAGTPLFFNSNGSQAADYPGGFTTLTQPFESGLFGTVTIVGVAHNSSPAHARFSAVIRNATTNETIVTIPEFSTPDFELEADQFSPDPAEHCDDLNETRGTTFQITITPTVNEVVVGPHDNLQLELLPTQVFGGGVELCVDHPHYSGMSLVVEPIAPPNSPPVAADDAATAPKNTPVVVDVLANDSDADGDALSVTNLSAPSTGIVEIAAGAVRYHPPAGFIGDATFTYSATDGTAESPPATVTVTVVNRPPVAVDDNATTFKNTPVTVAVLTNDSDPDGDSLSLGSVGSAGAGTAAANGDGTVTYTPATGVSGIDTFGYTASDGTDESAPATVTVEVVNRPPDCTAAAPSIKRIWPAMHAFVPVSVQGVTDPDGDAVTVTVASIRQDERTDSTGDGAFAPDGRGVGTSTAEVRGERQGGGDGRVYHVGFSADDGDGGTCSGVVRVSVPHSAAPGATAGDGGALYDSTV